MEGPHLQIAVTGAVVPLQPEVTTVGRGSFTDITLADPSVSVLHAEIVRRGPYVYVSDLGLSRNGTRVNGRLVAKRLLNDGDALTFGSARCRIGGIVADEVFEEQPPKSVTPELTRRELDVIASLCRPAMSDDAFVTPATAREIAADLVVTEAAVKQHLLRLYSKLRIAEGVNRRIRLANEVVALGLAKPQVPDDQRGLPAPRGVSGGRPPEPAPRGVSGGRPPEPGSSAESAQRWRPGPGAGPGAGPGPGTPYPPAAAGDRRRVTGRTGGPG